jgi:hypothetical protein
MKKLEDLTNKDLFSTFEDHKVSRLQSTNLRGGTSTALCQTDQNLADPDSEASQENPKDSRCKKVTPPVPD